MLPFSDRAEAGRLLAAKLKAYEGRPDVTVAAFPRGGVAVGFEIAQRLHAPLDILVVRKVGVPWRPELAMGAVASGGVRILEHALIRSLHLSKYFVYGLVAKAEEEVEKREILLRGGKTPERLTGRSVILVDDGAATGSTMLAAAEAVRIQHPKEIIIALPVASREAYAALKVETDKCICLEIPEPFYAVGEWYMSFPQMTDEEVKVFLSRSRLQKTEKESLVRSAAAG